MSHRANLFAWLSSLFFVAFVLAAGCGRSDLGLDIGDGGPLPEGGEAGTCNASTCPNGCCNANGVCETGTTATACGTGGAACKACAAGQSCNAQTHTCGGNPGCTAANCPNGCCDAAGACQAGSSMMACGTGGISCEDCASNGFKECNPQSHQCDTPGTCSVSTCPNGCCQPNGAGGLNCVDGRQNNACGTGAAGCLDCTGFGEVCDPGSRTCVGQTCGPQNCGGCCLGNQCVPGGTPNACGQFGEQCQNCGPNSACVGGVCQFQQQCGPQNCAGCCSGNTCMGGNNPGACGQFGQSCFACPPGFQCNGGICIGMSCGPQNCPGCCIGSQCLPGSDPGACGAFGQQCQPCPPGDSCNGGTCQQALCGPQNCPGCCLGNQCVPGGNNMTCGQGGQQCFPCPPNFTCTGGFCQGQTCGPQNCPGCCIGNQCLPGNDPGACGEFGQQCQPCPVGDVCNFGMCLGGPCDGGICPDSGVCGPFNCQGCCQGNTCVPGDTNMACGAGGQACTTCTGSAMCNGTSCQTTPTCGPMTCPQGCCDAGGVCHPGFSDNLCGGGGNACVDCTQSGSTCDINVTPRTCQNNQTMCPAPYGSCPAGTTTPIPMTQNVCTPQDLADAANACQGGATSAACQQFFNVEQMLNPACYSCLHPFDHRFFDGTGIFLCTAPCNDPFCNSQTGCATDCETTSCSMCAPGDVANCENNVEQGQCSNYFQNAQCVFNALQGACSFCDPQQYGFNFGAWLQGVGQNYCGQ